jgi:tetratricopeptide (TPR) repeat protein
MKEKYIQILGIGLTLFYGFFVAWLYWAEPKNLEEVTTKAKETVNQATTTAKVITNTYEIDQAKFDEGLKAFRQDNFIVARDNFEKADKEKRDAKTQFYIAYTYYRQGWGRFSNDDELFQKGLEQVNRVIKLDENFKSDDADLKLQTPVELKNELEEGLRVTASDFNPFKITRERK